MTVDILVALMHTFGRDTTYIGDAGVVAGVIEPASLTTERFPACVERTGTLTRGQLVIRRRP